MDGAWHCIAAGRANHAGVGGGWGVIPADQGNGYSVGVETDHTTGERWPDAQLQAMRVGTAAILTRLGAAPQGALCGHLEYAPGRKFDPAGLDMDAERRAVAALMDGDGMDWSDKGDNRVLQAAGHPNAKSEYGNMIEATYKTAYDTLVAVRALADPKPLAAAIVALLPAGGLDQAAIEAGVLSAIGKLGDLADQA
jgi:hypothetical protein